MSSLLQIVGLTRRFGGLVAVNNVSFEVQEREILSVIGPNGAGKSTLFKLISSFLKPSEGEVHFKGERISNLAPHIAARKGVVRTFQETTIFKNMTVRDNVIVAHHLGSKASLVGYFFGSSVAQRDEAAFGRSADEILAFLGLDSVKDELASNLPHGHLRALGIAIGLATEPTVLLL
ncbi:MAG: ATP-binding cassette domain-containing protein, partial [Gammaproteobacteria bacterium]